MREGVFRRLTYDNNKTNNFYSRLIHGLMPLLWIVAEVVFSRKGDLVMKKYALPGFLFLLDILSILLAILAGFILRFESLFDNYYFLPVMKFAPVILAVYMVTFLCARLYTRMWKYMGMKELAVILASSTLGSLISVGIAWVAGLRVPVSVQVIIWILISGALCGSRLFMHYLLNRDDAAGDIAERRPVLIVGAGDAGNMIAREIIRYHTGNRKLIGFIDDDKAKRGNLLNGYPVLGDAGDIHGIVEKQGIKEIIIAIPSADGRTVRGLAELCTKEPCEVNILPGIYQLLDRAVTVSNLRPVSIEDLLERDAIHLDLNKIEGYLKNKTVLVTGAGGSIGSEICRQVMKMSPSKLLLLGHGENSIYLIHQELSQRYGKDKVVPIIVDIQNVEELDAVFSTYRPDVVFHVAAHKHVPMMEIQPRAAILNNVYGTRNVADAAGRYGADKFVMISTDKAVNPTSVMGATKQVAEKIVYTMNSKYDTKYATVRFGNVLGSRGSVVPLFNKQIAAGGPVTVTHPDMVRYFMTIPEASQLVLEAGALGEGGELFLLDMGAPVKIMDLAKNMIRLSGYEVGKDIQIKITGLRPGEKLYEELLTAAEGAKKTAHSKIFESPLEPVDADWLYAEIDKFKNARSAEDVIHILKEIIPTYTPNHKPDNTKLLAEADKK